MTTISTTDLANAKLDVDHIAAISTSQALTATDRLGNTKDTIAGAVYKISAFNDRGPWATARSYAVKDLVSNSGTWYVCVTAHTSGATFAGDAATKWRVHQGATTEDLAEPSGASLSGFAPSGVGAVASDVETKLRERVSAADRGAVGDGVANDTAEFALLETDVTGVSVDLLGKTYLVDKQPTKNEYFNGNFKLASGAIFKASRELSQANRGAETTLKLQAEDSRYSVPSGLNGAIVVLSDSIGHGAFQGNLYQDGWVNILKRMLNAETGSKSYGFTPLLSLGSGPTLSREVHDVNFSGTWVPAESTTGGENILQGLSYTSTTAGAYIEAICPTFQRQIRVWYVSKVGGGTFSYSLNGGAATNVDTSDTATNVWRSITIPMNDNGAGQCTIRLTVVSGSVTLTGVGYESPPNEGNQKAGPTVQNFSNSGRRLKPASEEMIDLACRGSMLILALGYNDSGDVETDAAYNTAFQQRIDWIIKYCLKYNTTLIVADMCWWSPPSNKARQGLKRAATEARGIYVPLPDYLTRDQLVKNEYSSNFYMVDTLKKWSDGAHPLPSGGKWIAETVAKAAGLSVTSKEQALAYHDYPFPLQFEASSLLKNASGQMPYVSNVRRVGNSYVFSLRVVTKTGFLASGSEYVVNKPFNFANTRQFQALNTTGIGLQPVALITGTGAVFSALTADLSSQLKIRSFNNFVDGMNYGFTLPADV